MSVTFRVEGSPEITIRRELCDGEFEDMEQDLLPSINFSNSNAQWVLWMCGQRPIADGDGSYVGRIAPDQLWELVTDIRRAIATRARNFGVEHIEEHDDDGNRLFHLYAVAIAAAQAQRAITWS